MIDKGQGMERFRIARALFGFFAILLLLICETAQARDLVSGRYISSQGKQIVLELDIAKPPPSNLIVQQFLPAGVNIVSSSPGAIKFDAGKGKAKWLIKQVKPGKMLFSMDLSEEITSGAVRAEVLCRDKKTGEMAEIVIRP